MRYKVTQTRRSDGYQVSETYRFKLRALFQAWIAAGSGSIVFGNAREFYTTEVEEVA